MRNKKALVEVLVINIKFFHIFYALVHRSKYRRRYFILFFINFIENSIIANSQTICNNFNSFEFFFVTVLSGNGVVSSLISNFIFLFVLLEPEQKE